MSTPSPTTHRSTSRSTGCACASTSSSGTSDRIRRSGSRTASSSGRTTAWKGRCRRRWPARGWRRARPRWKSVGASSLPPSNGSSAVDYAGYLKAADAGVPPEVALLHGPETMLLDDAVARVTRGLFPEGGDLTLAREILDSREAGAESIVQAALLLPWSGPRRLVVAKGVEELGARAAETLSAYCQKPNPSTVL